MQWQRKLYEHEEIPPPHCWEEVRSVIDQEPLRLGHALYELEAAPPAGAWEKIKEDLQSPAVKPEAIPSRGIFRKPALSFAAAVAGFAVLASILVYVFSRNNDQVRVQDLAAGLTHQDSQQAPGNEASNASDSPAESTKTLPDIEQSLAGAEPSNRPTEKEAARAVDDGNHQQAAAKNEQAARKTPVRKRSNSGKMPVIRYTDGNYIQLVEPDGDVTRVSYKLADMVRSVHNPSSGPSKAEQERWNHTLEAWKTKMAQSTYIPSGSNFFDIADMVQFLNEGK